MQAIFLDPDGNVAEGPNMNLGIVTQDDQVVVRAPSVPRTSHSQLLF